MQEKIDSLNKEIVYFREMLESKQSMLEMTISYMEELQLELSESKKSLEQSNKKLEDGNNYAERLQRALLPAQTQISSIFPNSFVLFEPKFTLSGDFYWFYEIDDYKCVAVIDCTGHGVPGAMLSVMIDSALNQIVKLEKYTDPKIVLALLDQLIYEQLHKTSDIANIRDGADVSFFAFHKIDRTLKFSGAHSHCFLVNTEETKYVKGARYSIGEYSKRVENLSNTELTVNSNDRIFLYTDGIVDQFGGEENKKIGRKRLEKLLENTIHLPIDEQKIKLRDYLNEWKKDTIQTDDMLLVGVQF